MYEFDCDCVGGRTKNECGHEAAAQDLLGSFKVSTQVQKIEHGSVRGRPISIPVVGYAAIASPTAQTVQNFSNADGLKLVREPIFQFFNEPFCTTLPFVGTITGNLPIPFGILHNEIRL